MFSLMLCFMQTETIQKYNTWYNEIEMKRIHNSKDFTRSFKRYFSATMLSGFVIPLSCTLSTIQIINKL